MKKPSIMLSVDFHTGFFFIAGGGILLCRGSNL